MAEGVEAASGSALWDLQAELEAEQAEDAPLYTVPGWDPPVQLRLRWLEHHEVTDTLKRWRGDHKLSRGQQDVKAHAELLVLCCVGVHRDIDGQLLSIDPHDVEGEPPGIDRRLADLMGLDEQTPMTDVAVKLFRGRTGPLIALVQDHVATSYAGESGPGNSLTGRR